MTALQVEWLIFHVLSYLTTVLIPDLEKLNCRWVCGHSGPFWIWTLTCKKNISTKATCSTDTEAALFRLRLWDRCSHEEQDWMRMWGAFAVDGLLLKYVWKYIAIAGCVLSPACCFWHQLGRRCLETRNVPSVGHPQACRRLACTSLFFLSLKQQLGCGSLLFCRVPLRTFLGAPWNCHWTPQNESKRRLSPSLNLCLVKAFFNVY